MRTFILAMTIASTPAVAQTPTIFGLEFGKPVSLPKCKFVQLPGGGYSQYVYEREPAQTCHEPDIQLRDAPWRRGSVDFPLRQIPTIMFGNTGFTLIVDGKLEGIDIDTLSHNNTNAIIVELTAKFGKPASVAHDRAIVAGIALPAVVVTWRPPGLVVTYTNIDASLERGRLLIETPIMQKLRADLARSQEKARTPL